jgi:hypothetical protein
MTNTSNPGGDRALSLYVAGIFVTLAAMILAFAISSPEPIVVVVEPSSSAGGSGSPQGSAPPAAAVSLDPAPPKKPPTPAPAIRVIEVAAAPSSDDPFDPQWEHAPDLEVPLQPQTITRPFLQTATVKSLRVQALRDASRIAWRLSWEAPTPAYNVDADRFCDAVAIQLPLLPNTPFMMGGPGKPVHILHWKAIWQKDIDEHYQQTEDLYPNYYADFYWFATGRFPFPVERSLNSPEARQFMPAMAAGNPLANPGRQEPLEELVAEGFGTATTRDDTSGQARGVWRDGRWTVVIDRPLASDDPLATAISGGSADMIAFAVWDGSARQVGGRKQWSNWVPLQLVSGSASR